MTVLSAWFKVVFGSSSRILHAAGATGSCCAESRSSSTLAINVEFLEGSRKTELGNLGKEARIRR